MNVTAYITPDVCYGGLFQEVGGHTITPTAVSCSFNDAITFTCNRGWTTAVKGWYVFHIDNARFHRIGQLPLYIKSGHQCGTEIELIMHYDHDVIVVCEMT